MAIHTGRASDSGQVIIDRDSCTLCGECAEVCASETLSVGDHQIVIDTEAIFGCIACGQCMTVCPEECIEVTGRDLSPADLVPLPSASQRSDYDRLHALLLSRRSVRRFTGQAIDHDTIEKIVASVATAPMGIPPSDVELMILDSPQKVRAFGDDLIEGMRKSLPVLKLFASPLARPFLGRQTYLSMKTFILPLTRFLVGTRKRGKDFLFYDAPLAIHFHSSSFSDPADAIIAATYATIAAESLGLGSCMIGTVAPFLSRAKATTKKWDIPSKNRQGILVIFGYPDTTYRRALKRRLARVHYPEI